MTIKKFYALLIIVVCFSCNEDYVPKPKGFLRLDYPEAKYIKPNLNNLPFTFETNLLAKQISSKLLNGTTESYGVNIEYPSLKGTVYLTYKAIGADNKNLDDFLRDSQKLTLEHTIKADEIPKYPYENLEHKVYGMLSEVKGDVASPAQFYVTDSVNHFLTGSLYFKVKPNYDSILPAANYLQKDIKHIMETLRWK
jgi:gliding motility-associated lipoprotein GldD